MIFLLVKILVYFTFTRVWLYVMMKLWRNLKFTRNFVLIKVEKGNVDFRQVRILVRNHKSYLKLTLSFLIGLSEVRNL